MASNEVVLCGAVRTPIGTYGGALKDLPAAELGAAVIRETLLRNGLAGAQVQSLVMGNVIQAGNRMNPARQAGLAAGLPVEVPALTVNRVCGSGAQAVVSAALEVAAGMVDCAVAGGMENMDRAPYLLPQGRWGARMGDVTLFDSMLLDGLHDAVSGQHAGWHTEDLVIRCGISREDQDRWALRSQRAFSAAQAAGRFDGEIVTLQVPGRKGPVPFALSWTKLLVAPAWPARATAKALFCSIQARFTMKNSVRSCSRIGFGPRVSNSTVKSSIARAPVIEATV